MELKDWTDEQVLRWVDQIRQHILKDPQSLRLAPYQIDEMILDGMFEGFQRGELRKADLIRVADLMGYEVDEEFVNDTHQEPIDMKGEH